MADCSEIIMFHAPSLFLSKYACLKKHVLKKENKVLLQKKYFETKCKLDT